MGGREARLGTYMRGGSRVSLKGRSGRSWREKVYMLPSLLHFYLNHLTSLLSFLLLSPTTAPAPPTMLRLSTTLAASTTLALVSSSVLGASTLPREQYRASAASLSGCPADSSELSCHSSRTISPSSCCYNGALTSGAKESGLILGTQFWDAQPSYGPANSTTIHGLWPDYCDGTYPQYCSKTSGLTAWNGSDIEEIIGKYDGALLEYMQEFYVSNDGDEPGFWEHEWQKHGTCFNTLKPACQEPEEGQTAQEAALVGYFQEIVRQFKAAPTYEWLVDAGIEPSDSKTYTLAEIQGALEDKFGATPYLGCVDGDKLDEFWYYHNTYGPLVGGKYVPVDSTTESNCNAEGIKWLPK